MKRHHLNYVLTLSFVFGVLAINRIHANHDMVSHSVNPVQTEQTQEPTVVSDEPETINIRDYRVRFQFSTNKQQDNSRLLSVAYTATNKKDRKDNLPVYGAVIKFYNILDQKELLLGETKTNIEGIGKLMIPATENYLKDEEGNILLVARFEGTEELDAEENEISFKDVIMDLQLEEIDSIKTITALAYSVDSTGAKTPVDDVEVNFYIQGMLSNMMIEQGSFDQGKYRFELKQIIPGDAKGNIKVIARIEDSDAFGNVMQAKSVKWGTDHLIESANTDNTLWSAAAPIWMYVVLTVMLVGVWANYIYTIYHLFRIRTESRNLV